MSDFRLYIPTRDSYKNFREAIKEADQEHMHILKGERDFLDEFIKNPQCKDEEQVKKWVTKLSADYGTRIPHEEQKIFVSRITGIASDIDYDFHEMLDSCNFAFVDDFCRVHCSDKRKNPPKSGFVRHFSFATKYCHHCSPNKYPIYDSLNVRVLSVYCGYGANGKDYQSYVECYNRFYEALIQDENGIEEKDKGFYVDKYIQAIGGSILRKYLFHH